MKKFIALLLSVMMIIALCACGDAAKRETENSADAETSAEALEETNVAEAASDETVAVAETVDGEETSASEIDMSAFAGLAVGDVCEFGSYPQTEIVSQASDCGTYGKVWAAESDYIIDADLYDTLKNLAEEEWDANGDAIVDGTKYRRINSGNATHIADEDEAEYYYSWSDADTYHYFKYEPIKWRVLENSGSDVFLLSELAIDGQMYHTEIKKITWEVSTGRSWLNGYDGSANALATDYTDSNFIDTAFTTAEQNQILTTTVKNDDNIKNGTDAGNDTEDKIFFLSEDEVYGETGAAYGFDSDYDADDPARQAKSTTYAKAMGAYAECESVALGNCFWWIRTPGAHPGLFILVRCEGSIYRGGQHANSKSRGVRPAMHVAY